VGEIGFNNITPNEERAFVRQLELARERAMPVIVPPVPTPEMRISALPSVSRHISSAVVSR